MTAMSSPAGASGSLFKSVVVAVIAYLLVTVIAALATPLFSGKEPAVAIWLGGGLIFSVAVLRLATRLLPVSSAAKRIAGGLLVALGVSAATGFISFVVMVNIWERLGLGH